MLKTKIVAAMASLAWLSACGTNDAGEAGDTVEEESLAETSSSPDADETVSILRPDIEQPELPEPALEPLETVIGFPDGGDELSEEAEAALEDVLASEQIAGDGLIVLGAHSDSAGSDAVNLRAAERRGLAVAEWMIERGVDAERIDIIVFGEQNPAQPNALPDGSPNEEGRAANRRVELLVHPPDAGAEPEEESESA